MRTIARRLSSPAGAVALLALVLAAGGIAYATIPSADGVIHGCYDESTGALRVVDAEEAGPERLCQATENHLAWNQTGPPGPPGPPGPSGAAGAIAGFRDGPVTLKPNKKVPISNRKARVASLGLPAGAYAINAKLLAASVSPHEGIVICRLEAENDVDFNNATLSPGADQSIALQVVHRASSSFPARVACTQKSLVASANWIKITAIPVQELTNTDLTPPQP